MSSSAHPTPRFESTANAGAADIVSIGQLEQAINLARAMVPASGREASLSAQVARMANLYGLMIYERRSSFSMNELHADDRALIRHPE